MSDHTDYEQYASAAVALAAQMRRASEQHAAGRVKAVLQVVHALLACPYETNDETILVYVPVATWRMLAELVTLLPPECDRG